MKNIVIAGSGPVGLYTAIRLKKKFDDTVNVIVVDSHNSNYERPGIIAKMAVSAINQSLQKNGIRPVEVPDSGGYPPNSVFIGDLQKSLVTHAHKYNVHCVEESFRAIDGNTVILDTESIPCDLLIDCSGERRAVATYANKSGPVFMIQSIADNPIKTHFIAYIHMNKEDSLKCKIQSLDRLDPLACAINMEHLRQSFGWREFALPEIVHSTWNVGADDVRHCFYYEIPESLLQDATQEEQEHYLSALLKLTTGQELPFKVEEGNYKFVSFMVDPKIVKNPLNTTTYPFPVVICGDAHMSPEYRFGTGVRNGIGCAGALVDSVKESKGELLVARDEYEFGVGRVIPLHEKQVKDEYALKRAHLTNTDLLQAHKLYVLAYDKAENGKDAATIAHGLLDIADKYKLSADSKFREGVECRTKAPAPFKKKMQDAADMYSEALSIYNKYCPESQQERKWTQETRILFNLSKAFMKLENIDKALNFMRLASMISQKHHVAYMIPKTQISIRELLVAHCALDCKKLSAIQDESLIQKREYILAHELINLSQEAVDVKLTKECLKGALDIYKKTDSIESLHHKAETYRLLILTENCAEERDVSAIKSYEEALDATAKELHQRELIVTEAHEAKSPYLMPYSN